jgi:hypothetical protein
MNTNDQQIIEQTDIQKSGKPTDVMRRWLDEMECKYDYDEENDIIRFSTNTPSAELTVICSGTADNQAIVIVRIPVRAPELTRHAVGEFLHRMNYPLSRLWVMDFNDGEICMVDSTDLFNCQLDREIFGSMLKNLLRTARIVFPYLNAVITRSMKPDFAADQAICALTQATEA